MSDDQPDSTRQRHVGMPYQGFLSQLTQKRRVKRYLEIGVDEGVLFSQICAEHAVGVDPAFRLKYNVAANKKKVSLIQATSDEFFSADARAILDGSPDFAFLDGMHTFEYLLRDFYKTEAISEKNTVIALHDCLPLNEGMAMRHAGDARAAQEGTEFKNWWTGDVCKLVPIIKEYRPDLVVLCVNAPPTGLILIANLNCASTVLEDRYYEIVSKYGAPIPIEALYSNIEIIQTESILNHFDNTMFLRM